MRELLFSVTKDDLDISWHCTPGPGGMKKNSTGSACRILHRASGARTSASSRRERSANLKAAFRALVDHPKFKIWWRRRVREILDGETLEQMVDREMRPENLRTEGIDPEKGTWVPLP